MVLTSEENLREAIETSGAMAVQVTQEEGGGNYLVAVVHEDCDAMYEVYTIADDCRAIELAEKLADKLGVPVCLPEFISEDILYCVFEDMI